LNIWVAGIAHGLYYGDSPTQVWGVCSCWPDWTQNWTSPVIISYPETSFKIEPTKWEHDDRLLLDLRWEIQSLSVDHHPRWVSGLNSHRGYRKW
jgi:hypothetical protein